MKNRYLRTALVVLGRIAAIAVGIGIAHLLLHIG